MPLESVVELAVSQVSMHDITYLLYVWLEIGNACSLLTHFRLHMQVVFSHTITTSPLSVLQQRLIALCFVEHADRNCSDNEEGANSSTVVLQRLDA